MFNFPTVDSSSTDEETNQHSILDSSEPIDYELFLDSNSLLHSSLSESADHAFFISNKLVDNSELLTLDPLALSSESPPLASINSSFAADHQQQPTDPIDLFDDFLGYDLLPAANAKSGIQSHRKRMRFDSSDSIVETTLATIHHSNESDMESDCCSRDGDEASSNSLLNISDSSRYEPYMNFDGIFLFTEKKYCTKCRVRIQSCHMDHHRLFCKGIGNRDVSNKRPLYWGGAVRGGLFFSRAYVHSFCLFFWVCVVKHTLAAWI